MDTIEHAALDPFEERTRIPFLENFDVLSDIALMSDEAWESFTKWANYDVHVSKILRNFLAEVDI